MTYFKLIAGFECGVDKSVCSLGYPEYCIQCISKKFNNANFIINVFEVTEEQSEQKRKEMLYQYIWRKYQDLLNIRHLIILTKNGLPAFKMAVSDLPIDLLLLSGFIQANIMFSSEELTLIDKINPDKSFYELEYKNFHILLKIGRECKTCLILDSGASNNLKELLSNFTETIDEMYENELKKFELNGDLDLLAPVKSIIEKMFDVYMIYPLTLSTQIPPNVFENFPIIQKAIYEFSKDLLKEQPYFFISTVLETTSRILGVFSKEEILWNFYQMMRENIIVRRKSDHQEEELDIKKQKEKEREQVIQNIFELKKAEDIIFESFDMSIEDARKKLNAALKKAEIAEKNVTYQEALNEYQKALTYAKEFNIEPEIAKISSKVLEIKKLNKYIELDSAMEQASKAEKKKDYVIALKYLFQVMDMFNSENFENDEKMNEKMLHKVEQKIEKIRNYLR